MAYKNRGHSNFTIMIRIRGSNVNSPIFEHSEFGKIVIIIPSTFGYLNVKICLLQDQVVIVYKSPKAMLSACNC